MVPTPFKSHILPTFLLLSVLCSFASTLQFKEDGELTILQLTDMHYNGNEADDIKSQELVRNLIKWSKPDLIAVSGDAVSGNSVRKTTGYEAAWKKWTEPLNEAQIPYAYILGNHDDEGDLDKYEVVALDDTNPLSLGKTLERIPNTTNFVLPIQSSRNQSELAANIWFFDTGSVGCEGFTYTYGCIERSSLEWYDDMSKKIKQEHGTNVHHIAFIHIPIPEYRKMYNENDIYGTVGENIGCPVVDTNFFGHVKANGDINAMFCGHDHKNDFGGWYDGVELVYGRKSGYGGYGKIQGAKVIKLKETIDEKGDPKVTRSHFIFNEDGTVIPSEPSKPRTGEKKPYCNHPQWRTVPRWKVSLQKFFWELTHSYKNAAQQFIPI